MARNVNNVVEGDHHAHGEAECYRAVSLSSNWYKVFFTDLIISITSYSYQGSEFILFPCFFVARNKISYAIKF